VKPVLSVHAPIKVLDFGFSVRLNSYVDLGVLLLLLRLPVIIRCSVARGTPIALRAMLLLFSRYSVSSFLCFMNNCALGIFPVYESYSRNLPSLRHKFMSMCWFFSLSSGRCGCNVMSLSVDFGLQLAKLNIRHDVLRELVVTGSRKILGEELRNKL
jgi:hypothetical protein